ncbi:uroporphyrinogen-III synthase [Gracilibacillus caseinilyticus]|uniref:Uroporphyrinogen-III synthase n=1 Tax=Gracilibacillus caseinilyticus TaxID=2932256 RepID=A0ABY4ES64_9BACI|nr:uroporphyrinogen-III synthase [Gracilibacillus caseinilyticus]UOQ47275.1 uroporphyrinogen-III synthase [Gracilibacillus caseinilyticus]
MTKPLTGKRIMVTREAKQALPLVYLLESYGASCERVPLLLFERCLSKGNQKIMQQISQFDWLFFTSVNTVRFFDQYVKEFDLKIDQKIAAVGEKTAQLLEELGYPVDFIPSIFDGSTMVHEFHQLVSSPHIALLCGSNARREIPKQLQRQGLSFEKIVIYRTIKNKEVIPLLQEKATEMDAVFFTSPSTVKAFHEFLPASLLEQVKEKATAVAIGTTTSEALEKYAFRHIIYPETFTIENMVATYIEYIREGDK